MSISTSTSFKSTIYIKLTLKVQTMIYNEFTRAINENIVRVHKSHYCGIILKACIKIISIISMVASSCIKHLFSLWVKNWNHGHAYLRSVVPTKANHVSLWKSQLKHSLLFLLDIKSVNQNLSNKSMNCKTL